MRRMAFLCWVSVVLAITLAAATPGGPPTKFHSLKLTGTLDGRFSFVPYDVGAWDFLSIAEATGDLRSLGSAKMYSTHQPHADGTLTGGEFRIVAASGDEIYGTYEGSAAYVSADQILGTAMLVVAGGTGRFTNASGTIAGEFLETLDDPTWASAAVTWTLQGPISYSKTTGTETIAFFNLADATVFTTGGGGAAYWDLAPLSGPPWLQSHFVQGSSSQAGTIFYGSRAKESDSSPAATMTIGLPDLSRYTNVRLTVALAAFPDVWETSHRDSLRIIGGTEGAPVPIVDCSLANGCVDVPGTIDKFVPAYYGGSLRSQVHGANLAFEFQDLEYAIDRNLRSLTFAFASTDYAELVGIDSVKITGEPVRKKP